MPHDPALQQPIVHCAPVAFILHDPVLQQPIVHCAPVAFILHDPALQQPMVHCVPVHVLPVHMPHDPALQQPIPQPFPFIHGVPFIAFMSHEDFSVFPLESDVTI